MDGDWKKHHPPPAVEPHDGKHKTGTIHFQAHQCIIVYIQKSSEKHNPLRD